MERLDKFLCDSGIGTRSQVKVILKTGRVTVDGKAIDGKNRILEKTPTAIHERTPLIIGSADDVDQVIEVYKQYGKI